MPPSPTMYAYLRFVIQTSCSASSGQQQLQIVTGIGRNNKLIAMHVLEQHCSTHDMNVPKDEGGHIWTVSVISGAWRHCFIFLYIWKCWVISNRRTYSTECNVSARDAFSPQCNETHFIAIHCIRVMTIFGKKIYTYSNTVGSFVELLLKHKQTINSFEKLHFTFTLLYSRICTTFVSEFLRPSGRSKMFA